MNMQIFFEISILVYIIEICILCISIYILIYVSFIKIWCRKISFIHVILVYSLCLKKKISQVWIKYEKIFVEINFSLFIFLFIITIKLKYKNSINIKKLKQKLLFILQLYLLIKL